GDGSASWQEFAGFSLGGYVCDRSTTPVDDVTRRIASIAGQVPGNIPERLTPSKAIVGGPPRRRSLSRAFATLAGQFDIHLAERVARDYDPIVRVLAHWRSRRAAPACDRGRSRRVGSRPCDLRDLWALALRGPSPPR